MAACAANHLASKSSSIMLSVESVNDNVTTVPAVTALAKGGHILTVASLVTIVAVSIT